MSLKLVDYDMGTEKMSTVATFTVVNIPANTTLNSEIKLVIAAKKNCRPIF